jgi:hypothetical protein
MYRWILAALAALGVLGSAPTSNKSGPTPRSKHVSPVKPVPSPQDCGVSTDGRPPGGGC